MNYKVYSIDGSLYGKLSNNNKIIVVSKKYSYIQIIDIKKETLRQIDYCDNPTILTKHIKKYLKGLNKYV